MSRVFPKVPTAREINTAIIDYPGRDLENAAKMLNILTQPKFPRVALGIESDRIIAVSLRKEGGGRFSIGRAAAVGLTDGTLEPNFSTSNIRDAGPFRDALERAARDSGLENTKRWSVSLPGDAARAAILSLKEVPSGKRELVQILDFKAETSFGVPTGELRISRQKIASDREGRSRYLATAVKLSVIEEYESVFAGLGWRTGLVLPRAVCEMNWLAEDGVGGGSILISSQAHGFTAVLLRNGEPAVIRTVSCADSEIDDEIFRLLVYYQDRFVDQGGPGGLSRFLAIGRGGSTDRLNEITADALGRRVDWLRPEELGLDLSPSGIEFADVAAPAGLAMLGCR